MKSPLFVLPWIFAIVTAATPVQAQEPFSFGPEAQGFMQLGVTTGGSLGNQDAGGFVGGEWSVAWLRQGLWGGAYADAWYDFGQNATTLTLGPAVGAWVVGVDGGLGVRLGRQDAPEVGFQARLLLALGNVSIFGRYGGWPGPQGLGHVAQIGVTLKLPVWMSYERRPLAP